MKILIENIDENNYPAFNKLMNLNFKTAKKCDDCNKHIYYYDTKIIEIKNKVGNIDIQLLGKSYKTQKTHGEHLCICEKCLIKKFPEYKTLNKSKVFNTINEITIYAFDIKNKTKYFTGPTKERCIKKHGYEKGIKIWNDYCERQGYTNTLDYKKLKYNWTDEDFKKFNLSRAVTVKNMIKKYGEEEGLNKWNSYINRQKLTKSYDYMIKKYGKEQADKINKSKGLTQENFIRKYGEKEGKEKFEKCINRMYSFYSKTSQNFFKIIDEILSKYYTTYYASKNIEYGKMTSLGYKKLDYFIKELNLCIEFNGDIFHANPKFFNKDDAPNPFHRNLTSKDIWNNEKIRIDVLKKEHNIDTIVVWESDVKTLNIEEFINNIIKKYNGNLF
jgi:hypothetical protein